MYLRDVGCDPGYWIALAEDRDQWQVYVRAVMNTGFLESQLVIYIALALQHHAASVRCQVYYF